MKERKEGTVLFYFLFFLFIVLVIRQLSRHFGTKGVDYEVYVDISIEESNWVV